MTLRPDTIRPPAEIRKIEAARVETYRHNRSRRIFKAYEIDGDRYVIATRSGAGRREITREQLERDYTRVVGCQACGVHHDVGRRDRHRKPSTDEQEWITRALTSGDAGPRPGSEQTGLPV
jgi:predicted metalloprotease